MYGAITVNNPFGRYKISVCTVVHTFRQKRTIIDLLKSIADTHSNKDVEVIIVFGNWSKEEYNIRFGEYSNLGINIKEISTPWNLPYGVSLNIASQMASGNILVLMNDDVIFKNDCLSIMYDFLTSTNINACGPMGCSKIICDKVTTTPPFTLGDKQYSTVDILSGFLFAMSKSDWIEIGGIHPELILSHEEYDIALKFKKLNKKMAVIGGLDYEHEFGVSSNVGSTLNILGQEIMTGWDKGRTNYYNERIIRSFHFGEKNG